MLVLARPGELRHAEWTEFDLGSALWNIPAAKMKMRRPHRVPLARQLLALLHDLKDLTGSGQWLFPSVRTWKRPISENTLNAALRRLGYLRLGQWTPGQPRSRWMPMGHKRLPR